MRSVRHCDGIHRDATLPTLKNSAMQEKPVGERAERREFIRHPADIPVQIELESVVATQREYLNNISEGGICFRSRIPLAPGSMVRIRIPVVDPKFECSGRVVWCDSQGAHFNIGVRFFRSDQIFRLRMVEQICHIEQYKRDAAREGRLLTSEQAAIEWIEKNAAKFPEFDHG